MTRFDALLVVVMACGPGVEPSGSVGTSGTSGVHSDVLEEAADRITDAICRKREHCACVELESCVDIYQRFLSAFVEATSEKGGTFNPDCLDERIAAIEALGCNETEASAVDWETRACPIVELSSSAGDCGTPHRGVWPCPYPQWCDQIDGCAVQQFEQCEAPPTRCEDAALVLSRGVGQPCAFPVEFEGGVCASGLVCDPYETCSIGVSLGQACPSGANLVRCAEGYCDCDGAPCPLNAAADSGTCVPAFETGADCLSAEQCRSGRCIGGHPVSGEIGVCEPSLPLACDVIVLNSF